MICELGERVIEGARVMGSRQKGPAVVKEPPQTAPHLGASLPPSGEAMPLFVMS